MSNYAVRPAVITRVLPDSIGEEIGFEAGDAIVSINGTKPRDLIDYQFLCAEEFLDLEVLDTKGKIHQVAIEKDYDDDLGLEFTTALFDGLLQCNNHCPFCFIDQQPPGKRESLYYKDDDYRLSFLYGSYLTLTNLTEPEWNRIKALRLSPLFVSVHATEPEVRVKLLKNSRAGKILENLQWFAKNRLQIHAQVVVCPGINDGIHLDRTLEDLAKFYNPDLPTVASVAIVPVGLTKFRPPEDELISVTPTKALEVINQVQKFQRQYQQKFGTTFAWLADEWFLIAGVDLPAADHYEDYPQLGNGVGSIRQFIGDFTAKAKELLPPAITPQKKLTWVVGNAVEKAFQPLVQQLNQVPGLKINLMALQSDYWGQTITVTGLLTGQDLLSGLQNQDLGQGILLPTVMLKHGELRFLDDLTVAEVSGGLGVDIICVGDITELINACIA